MTALLPPRSLLFVPGNRPERFAKADAAGADLVCLDLEDAVAPDQKVSARTAVFDYLSAEQQPACPTGVRINATNTALGIADLHLLLDRAVAPAFVMLPKVESAQSVEQLIDLLPGHTQVVPILESARGLAVCEAVFAVPALQVAIFGAVDYVADIGCSPGWESLLIPRVQLVQAAAAHDVTVLDGPYVDVRDLDGLAQQTRRARDLGLRARSAIHPAQIPVIHTALAPTDAEIDRAEQVVAAFAAAETGAALLDGQLIELPVFKAAQRLLAQVRR
ncbi:MAG: CoA ester lyase [Pseudomonadales bacterium]